MKRSTRSAGTVPSYSPGRTPCLSSGRCRMIPRQLRRSDHATTQMNRTDDEPRTEADVMATAFSTMRKYGMNILTATQHMDINAYVKSDPRMPRTRLRRYLGQYGLRGEALSAEVRRIVAGPERPDNTLKAGIFYTWPYGWEPADFTPVMRRIFKGKRTRHVMLFDELPQLFGKNDY